MKLGGEGRERDERQRSADASARAVAAPFRHRARESGAGMRRPAIEMKSNLAGKKVIATPAGSASITGTSRRSRAGPLHGCLVSRL
jgi:hypothetical protein